MEMSSGEIERLTRAFTNAISNVIGPDRDIPAPDMGTGQREMAWMMDQYSRYAGVTVSSVVTGKPLILGGSLGRIAATGRGVMVSALSAMEKLKINPYQSKCVIQGFGNVGSHAALLMEERGASVIAISDISGAYVNEKGIDIEKAVEHASNNRGLLEGFTGAERMDGDELLELETDVLIPAAMEDVITLKNAGKIKASLIVEGANGPTAAKADEVIAKNGIMVVPDILANAGGVTVSYFEWVQNRLGYKWTRERVNRRSDRIMKSSFSTVYEVSKKYNVSLRIAAYMVAIDKIAKAYSHRGGF
jgi:glutamate dehydrogenase (NAD(P)+)